MNSSTEKRSFFRINSDLALLSRSVDNYTAEHTPPEAQFPESQHTLSLFNELKRLDREAAPHLSSIAELNRSLADYLAIMNKKLDLMARQQFAADAEQSDLIPTHVNLSEGGIAFTNQRSLYKGSHLAMQLRFLSDYSTVACFATVIRCDAADNGAYKVACKFTKLPESKQEVLSKHIMQAQLSAKRQQN